MGRQDARQTIGNVRLDVAERIGCVLQSSNLALFVDTQNQGIITVALLFNLGFKPVLDRRGVRAVPTRLAVVREDALQLVTL